MQARSRLLLVVPMAAVGLAAFGLWCASGTAQPPKAAPASPNAVEEEALMKAAGKFVEDFGKGDAKALAAAWTPDGDYTSPGGDKTVGRAALEKSFTNFFADNKGVTLRIDVESYRFPTPIVAIEDGTTTLIYPGDTPPSTTRYTNVHVRENGQWLLASVHESPYSPPTNHKHLEVLAWLVGEWADDVKEGDIAHISFRWTENQNFLISHFDTTHKHAIVAGGTQWIGWDPAAKTIRSWMFETHGGFGSGVWTHEPNKWTIRSTATLPDGKSASATNIVTRVDANTLTWEVKDRTLDGKPQPGIPPVRMKRHGGQ